LANGVAASGEDRGAVLIRQADLIGRLGDDHGVLGNNSSKEESERKAQERKASHSA